MDRPGREPLELLLGEIEDVLGVAGYPVNWPLGMGETFVGSMTGVSSPRVNRFLVKLPAGKVQKLISSRNWR